MAVLSFVSFNWTLGELRKMMNELTDLPDIESVTFVKLDTSGTFGSDGVMILVSEP